MVISVNSCSDFHYKWQFLLKPAYFKKKLIGKIVKRLFVFSTLKSNYRKKPAYHPNVFLK
jgi:hypothetical protein